MIRVAGCGFSNVSFVLLATRNTEPATHNTLNRIIGRYTGKKKGPLLICFGGIHGNEPSGVRALDLVFKMLEVEPITNPDFYFKGRIIGLIGNLQAFEKGKRFLSKDLNRQWTKEQVDRILQTDKGLLKEEDLEQREILDTIHQEIDDYQPTQLILLDLHTTTATGGIFVVVTDDPLSIEFGKQLRAPVIKGLLRGIQGTILHYFNKQNLSLPTTAICFEAGQHQEALSINRSIAATIACLRSIGCVDPAHIENQHDKILTEYAKGLPLVCDLILTHHIQSEDGFKMRPGYINFQQLKKGEVIADDKNGPIAVKEDCRILMPLYQQQGEDGFFLIKQTDGQN